MDTCMVCHQQKTTPYFLVFTGGDGTFDTLPSVADATLPSGVCEECASKIRGTPVIEFEFDPRDSVDDADGEAGESPEVAEPAAEVETLPSEGDVAAPSEPVVGGEEQAQVYQGSVA